MTTDKTRIRNAATVIVLRDRHGDPQILMGQRGAKAVFMPNKFVFPGGAVDAGDAKVPLAAPLRDPGAARLAEDCPLYTTAAADERPSVNLSRWRCTNRTKQER